MAARIKRHRVSVSAGSLAYHGFLAFFPAIIAALGILTLVHVGDGALHHLTHGLAKALPSGAAGVFEAAVRAATKRSAGTLSAAIVGVVVALWSSSSAMGVLQQTLDVAYEVGSGRKFFSRRVRGAGLMLLTGSLGGAAAALIVFGQPIGSAIDGVVPISGAAFDAGWTAVRWIVAVALVALLFSAYYSLGANRSARWRWVTPGSAMASAVFVLASLGFSFYISTFGSYGKTYGSFAGVAIFIFWLYLTGFAVLLGGELNAELESSGVRREDSVATTEWTESEAAPTGVDPEGDEPGGRQAAVTAGA
ncbi:MAG: YihY/virulence factor BrkB family protein [Acidimicrobiales bacterium]